MIKQINKQEILDISGSNYNCACYSRNTSTMSFSYSSREECQETCCDNQAATHYFTGNIGTPTQTSILQILKSGLVQPTLC